jgi:hypothetical protein
MEGDAARGRVEHAVDDHAVKVQVSAGPAIPATDRHAQMHWQWLPVAECQRPGLA